MPFFLPFIFSSCWGCWRCPPKSYAQQKFQKLKQNLFLCSAVLGIIQIKTQEYMGFLMEAFCSMQLEGTVWLPQTKGWMRSVPYRQVFNRDNIFFLPQDLSKPLHDEQSWADEISLLTNEIQVMNLTFIVVYIQSSQNRNVFTKCKREGSKLLY